LLINSKGLSRYKIEKSNPNKSNGGFYSNLCWFVVGWEHISRQSANLSFVLFVPVTT